MTAPPVLPVPPVKRNYLGWIALGVLFFLMISISLVNAVHPKGEKETKVVATGETDASEVDQVLRVAVSMREASPQGSEPLYRELEKKLTIPSEDDVALSRRYAEVLTELGESISPKSLAPLQKSKLPSDQALAKLYAAKKLSHDEAAAIVKQLPGDEFIFQLARVQAWEKAGNKKIRSETFDFHFMLDYVLLFVVGVVLLVGSVVTWSVFVYKKNRGEIPVLGLPLSQIAPYTADGLAIRAAWLLTFFLILSNASAAFGKSSSYFSLIPMLLAIPVVARVRLAERSFTPAALGLSFDNFGKKILWGIGGFFAEYPVAQMVSVIGASFFRFLPTPSHPAAEEIMKAKDLWQIVPVILFGSIVAPIWEEFLFRGLLFPALTGVTRNLLRGAVTSSFLFAMIHPQGPALWLGLATVAAFSCGLVLQTRSLVSSIVMHLLHNTVTFLIALLMLGKI